MTNYAPLYRTGSGTGLSNSNATGWSAAPSLTDGDGTTGYSFTNTLNPQVLVYTGDTPQAVKRVVVTVTSNNTGNVLKGDLWGGWSGGTANNHLLIAGVHFTASGTTYTFDYSLPAGFLYPYLWFQSNVLTFVAGSTFSLVECRFYDASGTEIQNQYPNVPIPQVTDASHPAAAGQNFAYLAGGTAYHQGQGFGGSSYDYNSYTGSSNPIPDGGWADWLISGDSGTATYTSKGNNSLTNGASLSASAQTDPDSSFVSPAFAVLVALTPPSITTGANEHAEFASVTAVAYGGGSVHFDGANQYIIGTFPGLPAPGPTYVAPKNRSLVF